MRTRLFTYEPVYQQHFLSINQLDCLPFKHFPDRILTRSNDRQQKQTKLVSHNSNMIHLELLIEIIICLILSVVYTIIILQINHKVFFIRFVLWHKSSFFFFHSSKSILLNTLIDLFIWLIIIFISRNNNKKERIGFCLKKQLIDRDVLSS